MNSEAGAFMEVIVVACMGLWLVLAGLVFFIANKR